MTNIDSIPSHSQSVVSRRTGKEYVLVPVTANIADMDSVYTLNETGAFIWDTIDGQKSIREISEALKTEFDVEEDKALSDVLEFIEALHSFLIIKGT